MAALAETTDTIFLALLGMGIVVACYCVWQCIGSSTPSVRGEGEREEHGGEEAARARASSSSASGGSSTGSDRSSSNVIMTICIWMMLIIMVVLANSLVLVTGLHDRALLGYHRRQAAVLEAREEPEAAPAPNQNDEDGEEGEEGETSSSDDATTLLLGTMRARSWQAEYDSAQPTDDLDDSNSSSSSSSSSSSTKVPAKANAREAVGRVRASLRAFAANAGQAIRGAFAKKPHPTPIVHRRRGSIVDISGVATVRAEVWEERDSCRQMSISLDSSSSSYTTPQPAPVTALPASEEDDRLRSESSPVTRGGPPARRLLGHPLRQGGRGGEQARRGLGFLLVLVLALALIQHGRLDGGGGRGPGGDGRRRAGAGGAGPTVPHGEEEEGLRGLCGPGQGCLQGPRQQPEQHAKQRQQPRRHALEEGAVAVKRRLCLCVYWVGIVSGSYH